MSAMLANWYPDLISSIISMEFPCTFLKRYFMRKPVVALQNVGCFLKLNHNRYNNVTTNQLCTM